MEAAHALRRRLGLLLVEKGVLTEEELARALETQRETGELLGDILIRAGLASRPAIQDALAEQSGVLFEPESGFGSGLRDEIARRHEERRGGDRRAPAPPDLVAIPGGLDSPSGNGDGAPEGHDATQAEAVVEAPVDHEARIRELERALAAQDEQIAWLERERDGLARRLTQYDRTREDGPVDVPAAAGHLLFFKGDEGYELVGMDGLPPRLGEHVVPPGSEEPHAVLKLGAAPLPGDPRACAYLEPLPR